MDSKDFRKHAHELVDWMADYFEQVEQYPVKSQVKPKEIYNQLPVHAPQEGEDMETIFKDFKEIIIPGITHWQHPKFLAYFPANTSFPSILGEMLTATLGSQCMIWDTSPAAAELEERIMNWIKELIGIPLDFEGVIQDTASTATLTAIITAREQSSDYNINDNGIEKNNLRVYCSSEAHSSVEKAVKIMGLGRKSLVKVNTDKGLSMCPIDLEKSILQDINNGEKPICVIAAIGTTGTTSIDPLEEISLICSKYNIWLHVDAAYAGSALMLPEYQWMIRGIERADSFVFNAHKWLFTNFDCSVYFIKDKEALIRTFEVLPEYLKTKSRGLVNDYRDWGVPLGRRFRALKLWFVLRNYGVKGIQEKLRFHIKLAKQFTEWIVDSDDFELLIPTKLNLVCFRYKPSNINDEDALSRLNETIMNNLNNDGSIYLTHTKIHDQYTLRVCIGQTYVKEHHVYESWLLISEMARKTILH
ncbi:MAG: pyridoxal-dependent decarboxylase [Saprospiraceae bacterium]|nr:pyridoxal-dependent decarboxylase [Saprospiraceae bacterium]